MDIKVVRLLTGEDVIAKVELYGQSYRIKDALVIRIAKAEPDEKNPNPDVANFTLVLSPYALPYMKHDAEIVLYRSNVVFCVDPDEQLLAKYEARFSQIIVPRLQVANSLVK